MRMEEMRDAAFAYAADLRGRGYESVNVFRYDTPLDNREPFYRNHRIGFGYAVRYTSDAATDARVWEGSDGERKGWPRPKFHDRSLTVFTGPAQGSENAWLTQDMLTRNAGVIADFAGEEAAPMYTAAWSPSDGPNVPLVASVIMKRFPARKDNGSYPWQIGPARFYHLIMSPMSSAQLPA
jgi:hypothetical protein